MSNIFIISYCLMNIIDKCIIIIWINIISSIIIRFFLFIFFIKIFIC